jgi:trehalose 6-phosphate phosphatase
MDERSAIAGDPGSAGLFLDFDGTLAEIVPDPKDARPVAGASEVLATLAGRFRVVALISGRRAVGLVERLGRIPGVRYYGLYGLEDPDGPLDAGAGAALRTMRRLLPDLERIAAAVPGARVEPKGFQASIHYRASDDPAAARRAILAAVEPVLDGTGMRTQEGKRVLEVVPARAPSKGDVVRRVAAEERLGGVLYAGDDLPDLEGFQAVGELRRAGVRGIRIAVRSANAPTAVLEAADLVVDGPGNLVELLRGEVLGPGVGMGVVADRHQGVTRQLLQLLPGQSRAGVL